MLATGAGAGLVVGAAMDGVTKAAKNNAVCVRKHMMNVEERGYDGWATLLIY
jgi:hypothetical protein